MPLNIINPGSCASTNAVLSAMPDAPEGTVVVTNCQTAGRGQRGNSWEAEPGKNLTFSLLLRPGIAASQQFELSMLVSLAIVEVLDRYIAPLKAKIKWPNDIYVGDRKICGILIENTLCDAAIERSIAGIGINVNQREFVSDAPNPVSLIHLTDKEHALPPLLVDFCRAILGHKEDYRQEEDATGLKKSYMQALYRYDGLPYPFRRADGSIISTSIADVGLDGMLRLSDGGRYAFKEIGFII